MRVRSGYVFFELVLSAVAAILAGCASLPVEQITHEPDERLLVTTYNVHFAQMDESVTEHAGDVASVLRSIDPDIVGLQELVAVDGAHVERPCPFRLALASELPGYGWIAPQGAAVLSQSNPILYRLDRFMPVSQGIEWFSSQPDVPDTAGWGNHIPRYLVWARFFDAATRRHVVVINVHLDHLSRAANRLAIDRLAELLCGPFEGEPVIVTGDLNEPALGRARAPLDASLEPVLRPTDGPTRSGLLSLQIDAIYVSEHFSVSAAGIVRGTGRDQRELLVATSDHRPVVAELVLSGLQSSHK